MNVNTQYDPEVGRPKKRPEDRVRTPARSWKPGDDLYPRLQAAAKWKGETVTNVLKRAGWEYVEKVEREQKKGKR